MTRAMSTSTPRPSLDPVFPDKQAAESRAKVQSEQVDQVQHTLRPKWENTRSASYLAHTKASKAKQTGKIELGPSRRHSYGTAEALSNELILLQRADNVLSIRSKRLGSRPQQDENELLLLTSISTPGTHRGSFDDLPQTPYLKHRAIKLLEGVPPRSTSSFSLACGPTTCSEILEESLTTLESDTSSFETGSEVFEEDWGGDEVIDDDVETPPSTELEKSSTEPETVLEDRIDTPKMEDIHDDEVTGIQAGSKDADITPEASPRNVRGTEIGLYTKEQAGNNLDIRKKVVEQEEPQLSPFLPGTSDNARALPSHSLDLEREATKLKQDLKDRSKEQADMMESLQKSNEALDWLRDGVNKFTNALNQLLQTKFHKTHITTKTLEDMTENKDFDPDAIKLHSALVRFSNQIVSDMQILCSRASQLQSSLADKERQLSVAITALEAEKENKKIKALNSNPALEIEGRYWKQCYKEEQRLREHAERKVTSIKKAALEHYQPDLRKRNRELRIELTETLDKNMLLDEKVKKYTARAQNWEGEYKTARKQAEKEYAGMQHVIQRQEVEMLDYVKTYHKKTLDPRHWHLEGLQDKIESLERDRDITDGLFNATKSENARLEDEIERLMDIVTTYEQENKKLNNALILGGVVPTSPFRCSSSDNDAMQPGPQRSTNVHPSYHLKKAVERDAKLREFRAEQEERRRQDTMLETMMEKVRARMIGRKIHEKQEWKQYLGHTSWEIWGGDNWAAEEESYGDGTSEKEREFVKAMREKKVLPP
jgi:hypothetical protein